MPSDLIFASSLNNGTGDSRTAITDGDRWWCGYGVICGGGEGDPRVIAKADTECDTWPSDIAYIERWHGPNQLHAQNQSKSLGSLAIGESVTLRWYYCITLPEDGQPDPGTHPVWIQGGNGSWPGLLSIAIQHTSSTTFNMNWWYSSLVQCGNRTVTGLPKGKTFRIEVHVTRTGDLTFTPQIRIWAAADENTLLYDESDFGCTGTFTTDSTNDFTNLDILNGMDGISWRSGPDVNVSEESGWAVTKGTNATFPIGPFQAEERLWKP